MVAPSSSRSYYPTPPTGMDMDEPSSSEEGVTRLGGLDDDHLVSPGTPPLPSKPILPSPSSPSAAGSFSNGTTTTNTNGSGSHDAHPSLPPRPTSALTTSSTSTTSTTSHLPVPSTSSTSTHQSSSSLPSNKIKSESSTFLNPPISLLSPSSTSTKLKRERSYDFSPSMTDSPSEEVVKPEVKEEEEDIKPLISHPTPTRTRLPREASTPNNLKYEDKKANLSSLEDEKDSYGESSGGNTPLQSSSKVKSGKVKKGKKVKKEEVEPQLVGHLPLANDQARKTFIELSDCTYASKSLGDQVYFDDDTATCDCSYDRGLDPNESACGEDANCVNRLLQIECTKGDCKCGKYCQNQRFQRKQYAAIDVVQTEKKGFGVRAKENLTADQFVYEYIGEVIGPTALQRKLKEYANEGIQHFYFMALDKEVFIDATKKGGIGRFLNHSCNPNCFVAKWTVGSKMRMGIFTKRDIEKDEELTFNYNVDRYGHTAQECFCGEPNCVGFIGGKTQTDIGGMDELYIDALGIGDEVEALGLRGTKKKKGKKLDEDFTPTLKVIESDEVPKVSAAVRQAITNRRILEKLLSRIQMTKDEEVQAQLLRLKGFNVMSHILKEYPSDITIITLDLQILTNWPLITRNKIESSKIEDGVKKCLDMGEFPEIVILAQNLLETWSSLELGYRIPKSDATKRTAELSIESIAKRFRPSSPEPSTSHEPSRPVFVRPAASTLAPPSLPPGWKMAKNDEGKPYYWHKEKKETTWDMPKWPSKDDGRKEEERERVQKVKSGTVVDVNEIYRKLEAEMEEKLRREEEEKKKKEEEEERKRKGKKKATSTSGSGGGGKDKRVMALFSTIVVQVMSKYKGYLEQDQFKKRARELTQILCDKERRNPNYSTEQYLQLTPEKAAKIKAFTKDWVKKLIERSRKHSSSSHSNSNSNSGSKPRLATSSTSTSSTPIPGATPVGGGDSEESKKEDEDLIKSMVDGVAGEDEDDAMEVDGTPPRPNTVEGGETPPRPPPPRDTPPGTPPSRKSSSMLEVPLGGRGGGSKSPSEKAMDTDVTNSP